MKILPVTRTWITGVVAVTLGVRFGWLNLGQLLFFPEPILYRLQVWRLVTPFLWLGKLELSWLINLFMMCVTAGSPWARAAPRTLPAPHAHTPDPHPRTRPLWAW